MTEEPTANEPESGKPASDKPELDESSAEEVSTSKSAPLGQYQEPVWTAFLVPLAVLIGAAGIIITLFYLDEEPDPAAPAEQVSAEEIASAIAAAVPNAVADGVAQALANLQIQPGSGSADNVTTAPLSLADTLYGYGDELGLDNESFQQCLADSSVAQIINDQLRRGVDLGVSGTPTFFINNKRLVGAQPNAIFEELIAAELAGSPTTLDGYSTAIQELAAVSPPRFEIMSSAVDTTGGHVEGSPDAPVVIVEFSDFQCPFCGRWVQQTLPFIRSEIDAGNVALVFLHMPLVQLHPNAGRAHLAAECAAVQGRFTEMHDLLFARQTEWANLN